MKNKIITILVILWFINCFLGISYGAKTGSVYLESNKEIIEEAEEIEVTVNLKDAKTAAFSFSLYFDESKLEYIGSVENTNVIGNRIIYVWYDANGGSGAKEGELIKFKFKAKQNGIATFTIDGEFYSEAGQLIQANFEEKQIRIGKEESMLQVQAQEEQGTNIESSNSYLQALRLDIEGITPEFSKDTYEYYLTVGNNVSKIEVLAISENPNATIEVIGNDNLKEGLNTINIEVTSQDKTQKKAYKIEVTKTANIELANANLEILAIENVLLNPPFEASQTNYKAEVSNKAQVLNILAIPQNEQASVVVTKNDNLKVGNNLVTVVATAPNGFTKKKYQIQVYKRNEQEEEKYNEEISQMQEMLENAYEIEKVNAESNVKKAENNIIFWIIGIVLVVALITGIICYLTFRRIL